MVKVDISDAASETGALLVEYLKDRGVFDIKAGPTVCYGVNSRRNTEPKLNANCMSDKVKRMIAMGKAGVSLVPWFDGHGRLPERIQFPLLARKLTGHGGTDIVPVFQPEEVEWRLEAGWDWFSSYVPKATEYRVWTFRGEVLGTYEKIMKRPKDFKYIGANFRNGFEFMECGTIKDTASEAALATKALELDFSAIDMLRGKDGKLYILEANTAPGVIRSSAQKTLGLLADRITDWVKAGYPEK
jgi:glutathione synthase/RimK-type ligase-like ATP-grasp enzyme